MDNQLSATTQEEAVKKVQALHPGSFVYCFGIGSLGFDVAVYPSEADFTAHGINVHGDNPQITARHAVAVVSITSEGEMPFDAQDAPTDPVL